MRRFVLTLASVICCLFAAGCDKCGNPVKFNVPSLPKACYDNAPRNESFFRAARERDRRLEAASWIRVKMG